MISIVLRCGFVQHAGGVCKGDHALKSTFLNLDGTDLKHLLLLVLRLCMQVGFNCWELTSGKRWDTKE